MRSLLHQVVTDPRVFDLTQVMAGRPIVFRRVRALVQPEPSTGLVIDIGGGTGLNRALWPDGCHYLCVDIDMAKLRGASRRPGTWCLAADGRSLPLRDDSVDAAALTSVAHHLPTRLLDAVLAEAARVLRPARPLIFLEPVWRRLRLPARVLWSIDPGTHPRTASELEAVLSKYFHLDHGESVNLFHSYLLCLATPKKGTRKRDQ